MTDDITRYDAVEGYPDRLSYAPGETVGLCVASRAERYDVTVARWGAALEEVWRRSGVPGTDHPVPDDADARGCGWPVGVEVPIADGWRSGFYLVTLSTSDEAVPPDRRTSYAGFVVRAGSTRADVLFVLATNTWNAYNNWGGRSLYTGGHRVSFERPFGRGMLRREPVDRDDRKARPRHTGEQPDVDGAIYQTYRHALGYPGYLGSAGWFTYERRLATWAERAGIDLDYAVSSDVERVDGLADGYRLVVSAGHDEYWSAGQRSALERHVADGGDHASLSGNTMFWQVRLEADGTQMVCHKYRAHLDDPVLATDAHGMTGMWADPIVGRPESGFLGAGSMFGLYSRFGQATARGVGGFVVYRDDHWMLDGTGLRYGDVLGMDAGVVGYETVGVPLTFDDDNLPVARSHPALPDPADVEIVAFTPASNLAVGEYPASIAALDDQGDLEFVTDRIYGGTDHGRRLARHGNAAMLCCWPFGRHAGRVVTIGSTDWVFGLDTDPQVRQVTHNVLTHP